MRVCHAVSFWPSSFLAWLPGVHGETGKEGWLRYAPCLRSWHSNTGFPAVSSLPASPLSPTVPRMNWPAGCIRCSAKIFQIASALPAERLVCPGHACGDSASAARLEAGSPRLRPKAFPSRSLPRRATTTGCSPAGGSRRTLRRFPHPGAGRATKVASRLTRKLLLRQFAGSISGTTSTAASSAAMPGAAFSSTAGTFAPILAGSRSMAGCWPLSASTAPRSTMSTPICVRSIRR